MTTHPSFDPRKSHVGILVFVHQRSSAQSGEKHSLCVGRIVLPYRAFNLLERPAVQQLMQKHENIDSTIADRNAGYDGQSFGQDLFYFDLLSISLLALTKR